MDIENITSIQHVIKVCIRHLGLQGTKWYLINPLI